MKKKVLIIPTCTDFNRGDQALVLETKRIIDQVYGDNDTYMMSTGETTQCEALGLNKFGDILRHPSRFDKKGSSNVNYGIWLKIRWGAVAAIDLLISTLLLNRATRRILLPILSADTRRSIALYKESESIFVKGGGFLHDYAKGAVGVYSIYYQLFHIKLALRMGKEVYIMPNSYGPFKNSLTAKMVNNTLKHCKLITARESVSANGDTNGLGINIPLYPDLGFFLQNGDREWAETYLRKNGVDLGAKKTIAITVRPYRFYSYDNPDEKYIEYKRSFVELCNHLIDKGHNVVLVVHTRADNDHENDRRCVNEIYDALEAGVKRKTIVIDDDTLNCYDLKAIYGLCDFVIGTRFHSVIFALEQGVPCIAVTYGGNKGEGIMQDIGIADYAIDIARVSPENLIGKFDELSTNKSKVIKLILSYIKSANDSYKSLIQDIKDRAKQ